MDCRSHSFNFLFVLEIRRIKQNGATSVHYGTLGTRGPGGTFGLDDGYFAAENKFLGFSPSFIDFRYVAVCGTWYIIAQHHPQSNVIGIEFWCLWAAAVEPFSTHYHRRKAFVEAQGFISEASVRHLILRRKSYVLLPGQI
ncbi:hypothetical protein CDAR_514781 [Caerostris darwini]|uniref:Uncharacterized protein n=1 Tax=Caerostris darwini TaxID=1538125 RepID=A0AAV4QAQ9_9ARAC|nr:hypothetical protein CDAR_514781 [Caerostris darwini]